MTVISYATEYLEGDRTIDLISIGLARDGAEYYAVNSDANWAKIAGHRWLCENVIPHLPLASKGVRKATPGENTNVTTAWKFSVDLTDTRVRPRWVIANEVREFILAVDDPQLWANHGAHDFVALSWLWGTTMQLPAGIPMWTHNLRQETERAGNPAIPPTGGLPAHDALGDARKVLHQLNWLREHAGL